MSGPYAGLGTLYPRLRESCAEAWHDYTHHPFVQRMADGSLPELAFRHYLIQDYLFLMHFARAYALAAFKSDNLADMRAASTTIDALINHEMKLHVETCSGWGIGEAEMQNAPEDTATMAYTRYVMERGLAGDILDLQIALAPCVVGYGEIGHRLANDHGTKMENNPYAAWIEMYSGDEYQEVARESVRQLDRLWEARGSDARFPGLAKTFGEATRLEIDFWQMGFEAA